MFKTYLPAKRRISSASSIPSSCREMVHSWVGTDGGLSLTSIPEDRDPSIPILPGMPGASTIDGSKNSAYQFFQREMPSLEDRNGDLLIGTWSAGLLRFRTAEATPSIAIRRLNATNSAYSLFLDRARPSLGRNLGIRCCASGQSWECATAGNASIPV